MARGLKASQEHSGYLRHDHIITQWLPSAGIFHSQQLPSYSVSQGLWIHLSQLLQQASHQDMHLLQVVVPLTSRLHKHPHTWANVAWKPETITAQMLPALVVVTVTTVNEHVAKNSVWLSGD